MTKSKSGRPPLKQLQPRVGMLDTRVGTVAPSTSSVKGTPGSTTARGYGWAWKQLRLQILARDKNLCQLCIQGVPRRIRLAKQVDHKTPKEEGGSDDPSNLWSLCPDCHTAKSAAEAAARIGPR